MMGDQLTEGRRRPPTDGEMLCLVERGPRGALDLGAVAQGAARRCPARGGSDADSDPGCHRDRSSNAEHGLAGQWHDGLL